MTTTTETRCLTCGGPAALCMRADRCVGLDSGRLRPPPLVAPLAPAGGGATLTPARLATLAVVFFAVLVTLAVLTH